MWKIHAGGLPIFSGAEADCRRLYLGYNEWQVWQGAAAAAPLQAQIGSHPATWTLPIELVDSGGIVKAKTP